MVDHPKAPEHAEPIKHVDTPEQEEQAKKDKEERRDKERETVRKQVEDAAKAHDDLGKKFLKEDEEERLKKAEKKS